MTAWCVGTIYCYITHVYNGEKHFLAVVDPMVHQALDTHNVPVVIRRGDDESRTRTAVIGIDDITTVVGLVKFSSTENKFKVVWPYMKYQERIGGKNVGAMSLL